MIFEVETLKYATLATVSRCGLVKIHLISRIYSTNSYRDSNSRNMILLMRIGMGNRLLRLRLILYVSRLLNIELDL